MSVFHYTSLPAALGILRSGVIYASHILYLNDSREFQYATDVLAPYVDKRVAGELPRVQGATKPDYLGPSGFVQNLHRPLLKQAPLFVACFSKGRNAFVRRNGLLSQWRSYGDGGVALILSEQRLAKILTEESMRHRYVALYSGDINYIDRGSKRLPKHVEQRCESVADLVPWAISQDAKRLGLSYVGEHPLVAPGERLDAIIGLFALVKHYGFFEENEFRVIALPTSMEDAGGGVARPVKPTQFRTTRTSIVPYIEIPTRLGKHTAVTGVMIGPSPHQGRLADSFAEVAKGLGIKLDIVLSEIPYLPA